MHLLYVKEINTCLDRKKSGMAALYATIGTCSLIVHLNNILLVLSNTYIEPVFLVLRVWLLLVWELQVTK